jgi:NIPSNAP protein
MISFHFPPTAANAAVSGHPNTGFERLLRAPLPEGSFWRESTDDITFCAEETISMIVEVRTYKIKPGRRDEFINFFETRAVPAQRSLGMKIVGPLLDLENPDNFVWLRSFPSLAERDRMKSAFYDGETWKNELEEIAMPMIESYAVVLSETSAGCVSDGLDEQR